MPSSASSEGTEAQTAVAAKPSRPPEAFAAAERRRAANYRSEGSFSDADGCISSGFDSSSAINGPIVTPQPWEARADSKAL